MEIEVRDGSKTLTPEVLDPGAGRWLSWKVRGPLGESQIQMATGDSRNDDPASFASNVQKEHIGLKHNRGAAALSIHQYTLSGRL